MRKEDVLLLKERIEAGEHWPVIEGAYPFEDVVEVHWYVDMHEKTGSVVLKVR